MFDDIPKSKFTIVSGDGEIRGEVEAIYAGSKIMVPDSQAVIMPGDEMRRLLPTGNEEAFNVLDPRFYDAFHGVPAHYQVTVDRKGTFPPHAGGNFTISVTGPNSRVNVSSIDHSRNISIDGSVFSELTRAISDGVADEAERKALLEAVADLQRAQDQGQRANAYQRLIAAAANHMTVLTPFLPALAQMLGG